jgi:hypothetical protein
MHFMSVRAVVLLAILTGTAACASAGSGGTTAPATGSAATRNPDRITQQELAGAAASNAYELVERLRPRWLRAGSAAGLTDVGSGGMMQGGQTTMRTTLVYLDNVKLGSIETLRTVPASGITSLRYLNAERAASTLPDVGRDPIQGAIVISTRD